MAPEVVPDEQLRACRCRIHAAHYICRVKSPGRQADNVIVVRPDCADLEDPVTVRRVGLDIDRKRRPADDDLSGRGCQLFVERGGHIACIDIGWASGVGFESATDERNWLSKNLQPGPLTP